jgi:hypothetical protein
MLLKEVESALYACSILLIALEVVMHYQRMLAVRIDIGSGSRVPHPILVPISRVYYWLPASLSTRWGGRQHRSEQLHWALQDHNERNAANVRGVRTGPASSTHRFL